MYNVQFMVYIVYRFSQNVQECTILLNFQIHCVQNVQNVHSSHPVYQFSVITFYGLIIIYMIKPQTSYINRSRIKEKLQTYSLRLADILNIHF